MYDRQGNLNSAKIAPLQMSTKEEAPQVFEQKNELVNTIQILKEEAYEIHNHFKEVMIDAIRSYPDNQKIKDIFKRAFGYNYDEQKNDNLQLFSS